MRRPLRDARFRTGGRLDRIHVGVEELRPRPRAAASGAAGTEGQATWSSQPEVRSARGELY
jgi:hypothetical protein